MQHPGFNPDTSRDAKHGTAQPQQRSDGKPAGPQPQQASFRYAKPAAPQDGQQDPPLGAQQPFILDIAAPASQDVTLALATPASLPIKIIRKGGPISGTVAIDVSSFSSSKDAAAVKASIEGDSRPPDDHLDNIPFTGQVLPVRLHLPELAVGEKYSGRLIISAPGLEPVAWRFFVTSTNVARPATLVLDRNAVTLTAVRPWCLPWNWICVPGDAPEVTVTARDKSGQWPLRGITARLDGNLKGDGPGLDLVDRVAIRFNGQPAQLFATPTSGSANAAPQEHAKPQTAAYDVDLHGQATIKLKFKDFEAGEYTIPLRFAAANSGEDDLQRLAITLQVRNSLWAAVLIIVLAVCLSFVGTTWVNALRRRADFLARVRDLRPAWLADEAPTLPLIWLRATTRQVEDLSKTWWGHGGIETRLKATEAMLEVLARLRGARANIAAIPHERVRLRATWKLDRLVDQLPGGPLKDQDVGYFKEQLDGLDDWFDPDQRDAVYWNDLRPDIAGRCDEVLSASFAEEEAKTLARVFRRKLQRALRQSPTELCDMSEAEETYERLRLLLEARDIPDDDRGHGDGRWVRRIVELHHPAAPGDTRGWAPIARIYDVIDDAWWDYLIHLARPGTAAYREENTPKIRVVGPSTVGDAYATIPFWLKADAAPGLMRSYLVRKKLKYDWTISVLPRLWTWPWSWRWPSTLSVTSEQPQIAQYSKRPSELKATVNISYNGRSMPPVTMERAVPIRGSPDVGIRAAAGKADLISFVLVLFGSALSGVVAYALVPTFGSFKEYVALFTWGATLDQGRNFIQSLGAHGRMPSGGTRTSQTQSAIPDGDHTQQGT